jgi:nitrogen regulatory protein PII-like uncharacterized protein
VVVNALANLRITALFLLDIKSLAEASRARLIDIKILRSSLIKVSNIIITSFLIPFFFLINLRGVKVKGFLGFTGISESGV